MSYGTGIGHNPLVAEDTIANSESTCGVYTERFIPDLLQWRTSDGTPITDSTAPAPVAATAGNGFHLQWEAGAGAGDYVLTQFIATERLHTSRQTMVFKCFGCKIDSATDENADLDLRLRVSFSSDGGLTFNMVTISQTLPASSTAEVANELEFDIGAALEAAGKSIDPGDLVVLRLYPHQTVGSDDMVLQAWGPRLWTREHLANPDRSARKL